MQEELALLGREGQVFGSADCVWRMGSVVDVGVVGLGMWGRNHVLAYADDPKCRLVGVCDRDRDRARAVGEEFGVRWTTSVADLIDLGVSAVSVATPDHAHGEPVEELLAAGKHVFVEKPLTTSVVEAERLAAAASDAGVVAMVDFQNRWNPAFMVMKDAIGEEGYGTPRVGYVRLSDSIRVAKNWLSWAGQSGPEWFLLSHSLDLACWLLDDVAVSVYATGTRGVLARQGVDCWDTIQALVRFSNCSMAFECSWIVPDGAPSIADSLFTLYSENVKLNYEWSYNGLSVIRDRLIFPWVPTGVRDRYGRLTSFIYEPMQYFITCVRGESATQSTFKDGLANVRLIAAVRESLESGNVVAVKG